ncbi:MAPEG family protein [Aurantiacibacter poecillastricola]|uniref:MAPEG family protein n=1 Tax=Aurantiacibacter poecillastricola TaxID=3064385 RepID=UPI00273D5359|nr:MAPEG family protein [Aurantiacibacter sp. 219JJ12-13]MDP5260107.1 MAPEG family protein [Aurantiacibacter sp. 219JJ12-13]
MPAELTVLGLAGILLLVHVFAATHYKTQQYGVEWNMGARDEKTEPLNDIAGRLDRARGNFLETLPLAIIALGGVVVAGKATDLTAIAAWVWLGARVIYLPLYWAGVPKVRTYVWGVSLLTLLYALGVLLLG